MKSSKNKGLLIGVFVFFLLIGAIIALFTNNFHTRYGGQDVPTLAPTQQVMNVPTEAALEGAVVCLPHKDKSGPQTLECAFGLQTDDGKLYALDAGDVNPPPYTTGQRIRAIGLVTPIEALSSDHWQKYDVVGIFSIKDSLEVL